MAVNAIRKIGSRLELVDLISLSYWLFVAGVQLALFRRVVAPGYRIGIGLLTLDLAMCVAIVAIAWFTAGMPAQRRFTIKSSVVFLTAYLAFMAMEFYVHSINPLDMEEALIWFDVQLFSQPVAMALEPYTIGIVTDFTQFCYITHFLHPFVLFGILLHTKRLDEASHLLAIVAAVFATSYLGYLLVPARSPCVIADLSGYGHLVHFDSPLPFGPMAGKLNHWIHENEAFKRDCFPSGHTTLAVAVLLASWRFYRKIFLWFLVLLSGLIAGTLYLRYHYVIDLVAGALLGWAIVASVPTANAWWTTTRKRIGGQDADSQTALDFPEE